MTKTGTLSLRLGDNMQWLYSCHTVVNGLDLFYLYFQQIRLFRLSEKTRTISLEMVCFH